MMENQREGAPGMDPQKLKETFSFATRQAKSKFEASFNSSGAVYVIAVYPSREHLLKEVIIPNLRKAGLSFSPPFRSEDQAVIFLSVSASNDRLLKEAARTKFTLLCDHNALKQEDIKG